MPKSLIHTKITSGVYGTKLDKSAFNIDKNIYNRKLSDFHRLRSAYNRVFSVYKRNPYALKWGTRSKLVK